jgi:hypothetical protein
MAGPKDLTADTRELLRKPRDAAFETVAILDCFVAAAPKARGGHG